MDIKERSFNNRRTDGQTDRQGGNETDLTTYQSLVPYIYNYTQISYCVLANILFFTKFITLTHFCVFVSIYALFPHNFSVPKSRSPPICSLFGCMKILKSDRPGGIETHVLQDKTVELGRHVSILSIKWFIVKT